MYPATAVFRFEDSHNTHRFTTLTFQVSPNPVTLDTQFVSAYGQALALIPLLENISEAKIAGFSLNFNYANTDILGADANNDEGLMLVFWSDSVYDRKKTVRIPAFVEAIVVNGNVNLADPTLLALVAELESSGILSYGAEGTYTFKTAYIEKP